MPTLYMLTGVPASGKSTWLSQQPFDWTRTVVISTDNIIDKRAETQGKTYSEVFQREIKSATAEMNQNLQYAIAAELDICWDQTNVTAKSRASKLACVPDSYEKVAVFFTTPPEAELQRRLSSRPGKTIPWNIVQGMASQLEQPSPAEGFDRIIVV
ncbi:AAA domain containing protein [uncultured Caudovirales phage]|uniref:AAA domain containing protein n=1 Tax=uncultured Caudovirales phage TaxID=2100421 RepID=A0A6J5KMY4_9CAUD|nr:AAA domain containing protein [uncultured Caudovirales phage]